MFSLFRGGIHNITPCRIIDTHELGDGIRNNPLYKEIEEIRLLRQKGDLRYKELKKQLDYITPFAVLKRRSLKDEPENKIQFSNHLYYDFDINSDVYDFKKYMLDKYEGIITLASLSCSLGGINVIVRVDTNINDGNFSAVYDYVLNEYFDDVKSLTDSSCTDIGRPMFLSYDPNLYLNYDNKIMVPDDITKINKCKSQSISLYTTPTLTFSHISFEQTFSSVKLKTEYDNKNSIVDIDPVPYASIRFPRIITDGNKRRIYTGILYALVYLNPKSDANYLYNVLRHLNDRFAKPKMDINELKRLFEFIYSNIDYEDILSFPTKIKKVHFNKNCGLTPKERSYLANAINGVLRMNDSIKRIQNAKVELLAIGEKVSKINVKNQSKLSYPTVLKYFNSEAYDINQILEALNL
jgi:hypothetical protein